MSKRLQVVLSDEELRDIQRTARRGRMSVSQWVRQALHEARRAEPGTEPDKKLATIRWAAQHEFPTANIDQMLGEIGQDKLGDLS